MATYGVTQRHGYWRVTKDGRVMPSLPCEASQIWGDVRGNKLIEKSTALMIVRQIKRREA